MAQNQHDQRLAEIAREAKTILLDDSRRNEGLEHLNETVHLNGRTRYVYRMMDGKTFQVRVCIRGRQTVAAYHKDYLTAARLADCWTVHFKKYRMRGSMLVHESDTNLPLGWSEEDKNDPAVRAWLNSLELYYIESGIIQPHDPDVQRNITEAIRERRSKRTARAEYMRNHLEVIEAITRIEAKLDQLVAMRAEEPVIREEQENKKPASPVAPVAPVAQVTGDPLIDAFINQKRP